MVNDYKTISITEISNNFSEIAESVKESKEPVIITKNDKPNLVLLDYEAFKKLVSSYNKENPVKTPGDIMDEYEEVFKALAK